MLSTLLDLLAPPACQACRAPVDAAEQLCGACRTSLPWLRDPCPRCALPLPCRRCPARRAAFSAAWAAVEHEGTARDLVLALKLRGMLGAADVMAGQIAARMPFREGVLVPVPGARASRRRRGLDPAAEIARALERRTGRAVAECLAREEAGRQLGRTRAERRFVRGFDVAGDAPEVAILVDDVHTTGATLDACAGALRSVGTRHVVAVSYARTLRRG